MILLLTLLLKYIMENIGLAHSSLHMLSSLNFQRIYNLPPPQTMSCAPFFIHTFFILCVLTIFFLNFFAKVASKSQLCTFKAKKGGEVVFCALGPFVQSVQFIFNLQIKPSNCFWGKYMTFVGLQRIAPKRPAH